MSDAAKKTENKRRSRTPSEKEIIERTTLRHMVNELGYCVGKDEDFGPYLEEMKKTKAMLRGKQKHATDASR